MSRKEAPEQAEGRLPEGGCSPDLEQTRGRYPVPPAAYLKLKKAASEASRFLAFSGICFLNSFKG